MGFHLAGSRKYENYFLITEGPGVAVVDNHGNTGRTNYRAHHDFYLDLDLDIDPYYYDGTPRERFVKIMSESTPVVQARVLEGILDRFALGSSELRTQVRRDEMTGWIVRLRG